LCPTRDVNPTKSTHVSFAPQAAEPLELKIPILASAMDGVVDVGFAHRNEQTGRTCRFELEGVQTRYKNRRRSCKKSSSE